ncbi:hypothetical protein IEQ34_022015 [Dendrobium chrysotoxum]|uniref:Uncharacterized protein n=1 Tax=Dendrobium chrysotoxum TaxID=161865 RepID=A0AAV7FJY8_DENCH|nr:hypothetical protein IEQ34_022015 [Dendrobium chrysotoxum]
MMLNYVEEVKLITNGGFPRGKAMKLLKTYVGKLTIASQLGIPEHHNLISKRGFRNPREFVEMMIMNHGWERFCVEPITCTHCPYYKGNFEFDDYHAFYHTPIDYEEVLRFLTVSGSNA